MGFSTASVRIRDLDGVESEHRFTVPNELSNGRVSGEEKMMAVCEMALQGLPAGTSLVSDSFTLEEDASDKNPVTRFFTSSVRETVSATGLSKLFTPRQPVRVVNLAPVVITAEDPKKGTLINVNDLPDASINVNDLPDA
jgi:hypothetical protein